MSSQLSAAPAPESRAGDTEDAVGLLWSSSCSLAVSRSSSLAGSLGSFQHCSHAPWWNTWHPWSYSRLHLGSDGGAVRGRLLCLLCWPTPLPGALSAGLGVTESRLPSSSRHTARPPFSWRNPWIRVSSPDLSSQHPPPWGPPVSSTSNSLSRTKSMIADRAGPPGPPTPLVNSITSRGAD